MMSECFLWLLESIVSRVSCIEGPTDSGKVGSRLIFIPCIFPIPSIDVRFAPGQLHLPCSSFVADVSKPRSSSGYFGHR